MLSYKVHSLRPRAKKTKRDKYNERNMFNSKCGYHGNGILAGHVALVEFKGTMVWIVTLYKDTIT